MLESELGIILFYLAIENYGNIKRSRLIFETKKYGRKKKISTKLSGKNYQKELKQKNKNKTRKNK